jgi:O-antigen/teichoic acid export membrane protein
MQLAVFFVTTSDRFFITNYYSVEETAIYNVAAILAGTIFVFFSAVMTYILPRLYRSAPFNWQNTRHLFFSLVKIIGIALLAVVGISLAIFKWYLKPGYEQSIPIFFVLLLSYFIWNIAGYFTFIINFYRNKKVLAIIPFLLISFAFLNFTFFAKNVSFSNFVYSELLMCVFAISVYLFFCKRLGFFNKQA